MPPSPGGAGGGSLPPQVRVPARPAQPSPSTCPLPLLSSSLQFLEGARLRIPAHALAGGSCQPSALLPGCPPGAPILALSWPVRPLPAPSPPAHARLPLTPFSLYGRLAQSATDIATLLSLPSRPPTPASTSVWPLSPAAPPQARIQVAGPFQVRGLQRLGGVGSRGSPRLPQSPTNPAHLRCHHPTGQD